jgi:hypothetical protein
MTKFYPNNAKLLSDLFSQDFVVSWLHFDSHLGRYSARWSVLKKGSRIDSHLEHNVIKNHPYPATFSLVS